MSERVGDDPAFLASTYVDYPGQLLVGVRAQGPSISRPVLSVRPSVPGVRPSTVRPVPVRPSVPGVRPSTPSCPSARARADLTRSIMHRENVQGDLASHDSVNVKFKRRLHTSQPLRLKWTPNGPQSNRTWV